MSSVGIGFVVLWMAIAFFILRFIAIRIFAETGRAEIAALGIVVAFTAGAVWPYSERFHLPGTSKENAGADVAPPAQSVAASPGAMRDISARCKDAASFGNNGAGSLDVVHRVDDPAPLADGGALPAHAGFVLQGWAVSSKRDAVASAVCLVVDGRVEPKAAVTYGGRRADVANTYHIPALEPSAFQIVVRGDAVTAGHHRIAVAAESQGGGFDLIPGARGIDLQ